MAVNPRAANVGTVTHPVTLPTRSLALGEGARRTARAGHRSRCWPGGSRFGDTPTGMLAALASTAVAWTVGSPMLRDRGEYHRALAVRLVRHAQAATLVTALVVAAAALLDTGAEPLRLVAASLFGFLAVAGWDVRRHRMRTTESPLRVLGLGAGEEATRLADAFEARDAHGVELVGFVGNHSHAVVPVLGELDELSEVVRQYDIDAIVLTANRHRLPLLEHLLDVRPHAGGARAERSLRARLRMRPGGGDQRRLVHRGAHAAPPSAGLARAPRRRHRRLGTRRRRCWHRSC